MMTNKEKYILIFVAIISIAALLYIMSPCKKSGKKSREGLQTGCTWYIKSAIDIGDTSSGSTTSGAITSLQTCPLGDIVCTDPDVVAKAKLMYETKVTGYKMGTILASNKIPVTSGDANQCDFAFEKLTTGGAPSGTESRRFTFLKPKKMYPSNLCSVSSSNTGSTLERCVNWCEGCGAVPGVGTGELSETLKTEYTTTLDCPNKLVMYTCAPK